MTKASEKNAAGKALAEHILDMAEEGRRLMRLRHSKIIEVTGEVAQEALDAARATGFAEGRDAAAGVVLTKAERLSLLRSMSATDGARALRDVEPKIRALAPEGGSDE